MDTSVRKASVPGGRRGSKPGSVRPAVSCCGCSILLLLLCGCEIFEPPSPSEDAAIRSFFQTDNPRAASPAPATSTSPRRTSPGTSVTAAQPAETTRAPSPLRARSQPRPAGEPRTPPAQPAKGAEKLIASRPAAFPAPASAPAPRTAAANTTATTPLATATTASRPVANELIVKGPPRLPHRDLTGNSRLLLPALGLVALVAALAIYSKRDRLLRKARKKAGADGLVMPGELKLKDSVIRGPTAMGLIAPEPRQRSSIVQGFLAVVVLAVSKAAALCASLAALCASLVSSWKVSRTEPSDLPSQPVGSTELNPDSKIRAQA